MRVVRASAPIQRRHEQAEGVHLASAVRLRNLHLSASGRACPCSDSGIRSLAAAGEAKSRPCWRLCSRQSPGFRKAMARRLTKRPKGLAVRRNRCPACLNTFLFTDSLSNDVLAGRLNKIFLACTLKLGDLCLSPLAQPRMWVDICVCNVEIDDE